MEDQDHKRKGEKDISMNENNEKGTENMHDENYTPPTVEEIKQLSEHGKIKSLKPFYIEFDFRDAEPVTIESQERYAQLATRLFAVIDKVTDKYPELLNITPGADIESQETFIEFFTRLLSFTEKENPRPNNALVYFPDKTALFVPTLRDCLYALSGKKNKTAYIAKADKQLQYIFDENGNFTIGVEDEQTTFEKVSKQKPLSAKETDTDLLMTLASAVEASYLSSYGYIITVYLPNFAKAIGVQFATEGKEKEQKQYDLKTKLADLENIIGVLVKEKKVKAAFKILELDQANKTLTFASPYLYSLMEIFEKERITASQKKNNKPIYDIKGLSRLVDSKINTARNKVTTQLVYYIVARIHEHGNKTDAAKKPGKVFDDPKLRSVTISYKDIIKNVPLLEEAWKENKKTRARTLDRAVFGVNYNRNLKNPGTPIIEDYLRKYTRIFEYWKDAEIKIDTVSMKNLEAGITFTHHGYNGDFENDLQLPFVVNSDTKNDGEDS